MGEHRLLELKARRPDLRAEAAWCEANARFIEDVRQEDTYFHAREGRLKLRVTEGREEGTLIYYEREDRPDPKRGRVSLFPVPRPNALFEILREALGILVEVRKRRRIYRWGEVQIHLDQVVGLGDFIEFERLIDSEGDARQAEAEFAELRAVLEVKEEALVSGSYSDAVLALSPSRRRA